MTLKDLAWTAEGEVVSVGVMFPVKKWTGDPPSAETLTREDVQQSGCCVGRRLAVMADGQVLAATYTAGHSRIYADRVVAPGGPNIGDLEVRADGREAIGISGESNHVLLFDLETWWQAFEHDGDVRSVAISADGQRIAMGGEEQVRVVTREGELLMTLQHTSGSAVDVAWSPDGRWLAMGGYDGTAWLWEGDELRAVFAGHDRQVASLAFLPDSSALVTGSWDSTVRLWTLHAVQAPLSELEPVIEELWGHVAADGSAQP